MLKITGRCPNNRKRLFFGFANNEDEALYTIGELLKDWPEWSFNISSGE